ncbi:glycosyltransferase [Rivularia sp. PCC 7116]|uniref:glycosyltransferase family 4 protein n=1 Tax=Rivularia sp. PCC 7116 TaxID=373994 RepID=UPI00029ED554|nr:glycosyltransferase [Rivularia sp. PCC 7116]AFY52859.1 glycosyltransferase [Rivularia sp. PCC 7116]
MMKIVYCTTGLDTGGAEMMLYQLLSKINRECFSPTVISLLDKGTLGNRIEANGIPIYTLNMEQGIPTPANIWRLIKIIRQIKPDLIQGWMYHGNIAALWAKLSLLSQVPVLWSIHYSPTSLSLEKKLTALLIKSGAYVSPFSASNIFVSQTSRHKHEKLGYHSKHNCVIPNGFDTSIFAPSSAARSKIRFELSLPEDSILIGMMGRYHPMKDHNNFLQAAALISQKYDNENIYFILAGTEVDKDNKNLVGLIKDLQLVKKTKLLGERRDIPQLAAAFDIFTLPSAYGEAFPLVVGEAMSCGVPCVVTDVGDSALIVGDTGRVISPQNPEALAQAWRELINMETSDREALGKAARARIQKLFSLDSVVSEYEKLYASLA